MLAPQLQLMDEERATVTSTSRREQGLRDNAITETALVSPQGTDLSPGDLLWSLLCRFRLSHREQQIIVKVLLAPAPLTSWQLARRAGLAYSHTKAVVRSLIAWDILEKTPEGIRFQPDAARWRPPSPPQP